jgi:hypothetical protein
MAAKFFRVTGKKTAAGIVLGSYLGIILNFASGKFFDSFPNKPGNRHTLRTTLFREPIISRQ